MKAAYLLLMLVATVAAAQAQVVTDSSKYELQPFAAVADPFHLAFDDSGNLYVGRNDPLDPGGALSIHKVSSDGATVVAFGAPIPDPDGVLVDPAGDIAAAGSVLVASIFNTVSRISEITSDGLSTTTLVQVSNGAAMWNPQQMAFDSNGDLLYANCPGPLTSGNATVGKIGAGTTVPTLFHAASLASVSGRCFGGIALTGGDRVFVSALNDGRVVEVSPPDQSDVATGLSQPDALAYDSQGALGADKRLYVAQRGNGNITRINPDTGMSEIFASGFNQPFGLAFGADGCLYVSEFGTDQIWNICAKPLEVSIDIKPGDFPNCFNLNGHGVIPVAVLGSADFDVMQIDLTTLSFDGLELRVRGNGAPQCAVEDVSGPAGTADGWNDLVCQFSDDPSLWVAGDSTATLTGELFDGQEIQGTDEICVVP